MNLVINRWSTLTFLFTDEGTEFCNKVVDQIIYILLTVDCFFFLKVINENHPTYIYIYIYQKTDAMILPPDGTLFAFFGAKFSLSVHCFDYSFVTSVTLDWNILTTLILFHCDQTRHLFRKTTFSCPNLQSICDLQHFSIYLPCLPARTLVVNGHPILFCGFSSPFQSLSPHLGDHWEVPLGSSYDLV